MYITSDGCNGYTLNWTNYHTDEDNNEHQEWFEYHLRDDFMKCVRELRTTPPTTSEAIIEECKKARDFEKREKDLNDTNKALELENKKLQQVDEEQ